MSNSQEINPVEPALVGILLVHPEAWQDVASTGLSHKDFSDDKLSIIYDCVSYMSSHGEPVDYLTVSSKLERAGVLDDVGGSEFLTGLFDPLSTPTSAGGYARDIRKRALLRSLKKASGVALRAVEKSEELDIVSQKIADLALKSEKMDAATRDVSGTDFYDSVLEYMKEAEQGDVPRMSTGFVSIDELLGGGFAKGDYIIVGGRSGMGKSAFAIDVVKKACKGKNVLFFSFEMSRKKIIKRFTQADHASAGLFSQDENGIRGRFFDNEDSDSDIETIEKNILHWTAKEDVDLVIIDHFHIVNIGTDRKSFYESKTLLSGKFQRLARKVQVPFLVLSQLNREAEGKPPQIKDLRDSGALEQDADVVMLLHGSRTRTDEPHFINVAKNRDGDTGIVQLHFDRQKQTFQEGFNF